MPLKVMLLVSVLAVVPASLAQDLPCNAQRELVGEVTSSTAIVQANLTLRPEQNPMTDVWRTRKPEWVPWSQDISEGVPGKQGWVRVHYGTRPDFSGAQMTERRNAEAEHDCSVPFKLSGLRPATTYWYRAELANRNEQGPLDAPSQMDVSSRTKVNSTSSGRR
jgi:phosphodiesterase/alkaline phosphatase D-like protein